MARLFRVLKEIRLFAPKSSDHSETVQFIHKLVDMEENKVEEVNGEPPAKKQCTEEVTEKAQRKIRKRNVALLLAYNGANYFGMQVNQGFSTVEEALVNALDKAGYIPSDAIGNLHLIHFQRAARTDKGVSAARQVVSFKIAENFDIGNINSYLPDDIKVFGIKRVTKGFNSKGQCCGRTYSYTLPTYAFSPELHTEYPENYRIPRERLLKVNEELQQYVGTHCFHNFTSKKDGRDPSAQRYVVRFEAGEPFVNKEEFVTLTVRGQSFMLHQIRKMIGYLIATMKGFVPETVKSRIWNPSEKLSLPMAPGLGLVLENVHYERYNRKFGNDGMHDELTWDEFTNELDTFKQEFIMSKIIEKYISDKVMFEWLQQLPEHLFDRGDGDKPIQEEEVKEEESSDISNRENIKDNQNAT